MSKGSTARPLSVTREKFGATFDAIFGKKPAPIPPERLQAAIEHGAGGDMAREVEWRTAPAYGPDDGLWKPAPKSIYCPDCGYDYIEHDWRIPEPNCPKG